MRLGDSPMDYVVVANANPMPDARGTEVDSDFSPWGEDGFDFADVLDIVNPLQHLPVVSTVYRELTGDELAPAPRLLGGGLFGGIYGAIASLINVLVEDSTGKDIGAHAIALLFGTEKEAGPGAPPPSDTMAIAERAGASDAAATAAPPAAPAMTTPDASAAAAAPAAPHEMGALEEDTAAPPVKPEAATAARPGTGEDEADDGDQPAPDAAHQIGPAAASVPGPWIADRMMQALDQYRELLHERRADAARIDLHI